MKSLVVSSAKGGVGKTTLSLHLAHAFVKRGLRVLLVDGDPQGAIGLSLSRELNEAAGLAGFVAEGMSLDDVMVRTRVAGFDLLPMGRIAPHETESFSSCMSNGERFFHLLDEASREHDLTIIDTPCGFGGITCGALRTASHVVAPVQAEPIALRSVTQMLDMIKVMREEARPVKLVGLVLMMLQIRNEHSFDVARELMDMFPRELLFDTSVPRDGVFLEATAKGLPVGFLRRPPPPVTHVFDLLAAEIDQRMGLSNTKGNDEPQALLV